jgi:16S rRNA (cytosine1402-N4)-methyltransferase
LSEGGRLYSFDKDPEAIEHTKLRFQDELALGDASKIVIINESYEGACSISGIRGKLQGVLLDLGVSSRQLDESRRGFSYRETGILDMRFQSHGTSAETLLNSADEEELEAILRNFGEEPFARVIVRRIVEERRTAPLVYTSQLKEIILKSVPFNQQLKSLSRVFQAIRIAINDELTVLQDTLTNIVPLMAPGGRIVVMSYHSLEDRIVKTVFRENSGSEKVNKYRITEESSKFPLKILTKKPLEPSPAEILRNPRARSARLRVAEKNNYIYPEEN